MITEEEYEKKYDSIVWSHMSLPRDCEVCGKPNQYWCDGTYGCENGHVEAHTKDGVIWWRGPPSDSDTKRT